MIFMKNMRIVSCGICDFELLNQRGRTTLFRMSQYFYRLNSVYRNSIATCCLSGGGAAVHDDNSTRFLAYCLWVWCIQGFMSGFRGQQEHNSRNNFFGVQQ